MATQVRCTVCGGSTSVRADAVRQRCEFCGAEFIWQATNAAAGEIERHVAAALAQIQPQLDALDHAAKTARSLDEAKHHVAQHVRQIAAIYQHYGYYRLMGIETAEEMERNVGFMFSLHLERLGITRTVVLGAPPDTHYTRMTAALARFDFDGALGGYAGMLAEQLQSDPRFRDKDPAELRQIHATSVRTFALGLPWGTDADLARNNIDPARPVARADGSHAVGCVQCGAEVVLAQQAESVTCPYCNATFRIRLEGLAMYHARGHTDVTAHDVAQQNLAYGVAKGDHTARIEMARGMIKGQAPEGSPRDRELTFAYTMQVGSPLSATDQAAIATKLGLGAPITCKKCKAAIALAPGTKTCTMCWEKPS